MPSNTAHEPTDAETDAMALILALLQERTGHDFSCYRPQTVLRRIRNRMISAGVATIPDYLRVLTDSENEAHELLERLTIKVSRFYRNRQSFDLLRQDILPRLRQRFGEPLRIWSAGCARGEEPYTLAMLLEEAGIAGDVLASDIDTQALSDAARAEYPRDSLSELPPALARAGLESIPGQTDRIRVRPAVRQRVRFVVHDLTVSDAPPAAGPYHLVSCRNVLIYLRRDAQARTLWLLHRSLHDGGVLSLGEAEWPSAALAGYLHPIQARQRLFEAQST